MTLGQKIKEARLERKMTQKDVVGDYITRNMLSKIENDSATPSVKTLEYLASALGLPAGYFMSDSEGDKLTPEAVDSARTAFRGGDYSRCLELLGSLRLTGAGYADEVMLLRALSSFRLAKAEFDAGKTLSARGLAEDAVYYNTESVYGSPALKTEALLFIARCQLQLGTGFNEALAQYRAASRSAGIDEDYRLLMAEYYIGAGQLDKAQEQLSGGEASDSPRLLTIKGQMSIKTSKYEQAIAQLRQAEELATGGVRTQQFLSGLYSMLEECYRELGDYKMAYHYASEQLQFKSNQ